MQKFKTTLLKFDEQGEKTGWTYIVIPVAVSEKMNPGVKKAYRVKGKLDEYVFEHVSLVPMGGGEFIIAINATMRKAIKKRKGDVVTVSIEPDDRPVPLDNEFLQCLEDEPDAKDFFFTLPKGHQNYFSNWIISAKTDVTKAKRIAMAVNGLSKKWDYGEMIRANKKQ